MSRALGFCRPDPPHRRTQRDARSMTLRGPLVAPPPAFSWRSYERIQIDQSDVGDCTAAGTAQALSIVDSIAVSQGRPAPIGFTISQDALYKTTRSFERALGTPAGRTLPVLTDSGAVPADIPLVLGRYGVAPMGPTSPDGNFSDTWDAIVNDEPDLTVLEVSGKRIITGEYRVQDGTSIQDVQAVLMQAPLGIGGVVDSQVLNFTSASPPVGAPNLSDRNSGGHWFTCTGWRPSVITPGQVDFEMWNTWGSGYGDAGHFWATEAFLRAMWDVYSWSVR